MPTLAPDPRVDVIVAGRHLSQASQSLLLAALAESPESMFDEIQKFLHDIRYTERILQQLLMKMRD